MPHSLVSRRTAIGALALPWLVACSTPLPLIAAPPPTDSAARRRLAESAEAHGLAAYRRLNDINISYDGQWRPFIDRVQPEIVDAGFRGRSQERLMPKLGLTAQAYTGASGSKEVVWQRAPGASKPAGDVTVWFNGVRSTNDAAERAAALVAEGYNLFLLGPLWLVDRELPLRLAGTETVDGRSCDVLEAWLSPGLGRSASDRIALCIDRSDSVMRRVRFTLEGFAGTQGAVAEVDTFEHSRRFGVVWPMRSYERVLHPVALPAHDWRVTGLDVNRGYPQRDLLGPQLEGAAAAPAMPL